MLFFFYFFLTILPSFTIAEQSCPAPETPPSCPNLSLECDSQDPGKVLQCIGSKLSQGLITIGMAERDIHALLATFPSDHSYYSIGYTVGAKNEFIIGLQTHFSFDKAMHFRTNPMTAMTNMNYYVHHDDTTRPTIIFTASVLDLPEFPKSAIAFNVPQGAGRTKVVYKLREEHREIMRREGDACSSFAKWSQAHLFQDYAKAAIVIPVSFYCKQTAHANYDVVVGDFELQQHEMGGNIENIVTPTWQKTAKTTFGEVPSKWTQDF